MHAKASSSSEFVGKVFETGSSSAGIYYGTGEFCTGIMRVRIANEGINDEEFWRWASQLGLAAAPVRLTLVRR